MDPATTLKIGTPYTRDEIHDLLGGDKQSYLPHVGGRIVCGCFDLTLNKAAPIEIDVGNAPKVLESARRLVEAGNAIPVFLKERVKRWRYEGMYQPVAFEEYVNHIREAPYRRCDAVGVLYLEPWNLPLEEGSIPYIDGAHYTASEGNQTLAIHYRRERNRSLVEAKKRVVEAEKGYLACEVCEIDFRRLSPRYGLACCEVHHLRPLALGPIEEPTRLSDLAIVCSNCHRMIHRLAPPPTVARLRQELSEAS
jgi:HNH endonuclease